MRRPILSAQTVGLIGELPDRYSERPNEPFDSASKRLVREWEGRRRVGTLGSSNGSPGALEWLTRTSYEVVTHLIGEEQGCVFDARLKRYSRRKSVSGQQGLRTFQRAMRAIFAHDPRAITDSQRDRVSKRAWHAYRHYVPPHFISGFFRQIDSHSLERRCINGDIEPEFEDWIVCNRSQDVDEECERGTYPSRIEEAILRATGDNDF